MRSSPRTSDLQKVPETELLSSLQDLLEHLSEWLLTKTEADVEQRYRDMGTRRAELGVSLSDSCWALMMTKEYLWEFLQKQGFLRNPIELYGEIELLSLVDQFFDRALGYMAEGYEQSARTANPDKRRRKPREFNLAAYVP
jgi:hypothetical protein